MINVNGIYEVIKGSNNPLSCDVALIRGNNYTYVFEAGNNEEIIKQLNTIDNKAIIISHFHQDHLANINKLSYKQLYIGDHTYKYTHDGVIINEELDIDDDVKFKLFKINCSHSKGSIGLQINDYAFIGDALAPAIKKDGCYYNTQLLKEEIETLSKLNVQYLVSSHSMDKPIIKQEALDKLINIYSRKEKNNPYIYADFD